MKINVKFLALIGWRGARSFILLGLIFFISHVLRLWSRCYYLRGFSAQLCMFEVCSSSINEQKAICYGCSVLLECGNIEECMVALCNLNIHS